MATGLFSWSKTSTDNATADSTVNWREGQSPSSVNDSARAMMASAAKWRDDVMGTLIANGTGSAYTISSNQIFASNADKSTIQFLANTTNTGPVTLSVDGNTAAPIRFRSTIDLPPGALVSGSLYQATYRSASGEWLLHAFDASIYTIPIGGIIDYASTTVPNGAFVFPSGQAISRTVYISLFQFIGTTYGAGDGSTTFNVPDLTGRLTVMKEATATRLTTAGSGVDGGTLGATGGTQNVTLLTANLPAYTPAGTITNGAITVNSDSAVKANSGSTSDQTAGSVVGTGATASITATIGTSTFAGTAQGGTSTAVRNVQPTIVLNKILRII